MNFLCRYLCTLVLKVQKAICWIPQLETLMLLSLYLRYSLLLTGSDCPVLPVDPAHATVQAVGQPGEVSLVYAAYNVEIWKVLAGKQTWWNQFSDCPCRSEEVTLNSLRDSLLRFSTYSGSYHRYPMGLFENFIKLIYSKVNVLKVGRGQGF